jgi:hypothetical protein
VVPGVSINLDAFETSGTAHPKTLPHIPQDLNLKNASKKPAASTIDCLVMKNLKGCND